LQEVDVRFVRFSQAGAEGLAVETDGGLRGCLVSDPDYPGSLVDLIRDGGLAEAEKSLRAGRAFATGDIAYLPPIDTAGKILCVGLNYLDHSAESGYEQPSYPTVFGRFNSSLIGHGRDIVRPRMSETLDYEGELAAIIGKTAKAVSNADALDYVAGYSVFNDGSIREYQHITPQWTVGKNFDATGAFGPVFVTANELPAGCLGLTIETRLNGQVVQHAKIDDMVFGVADLVSILSQAMTLDPGDIIVTGTPAGVGAGRKPPLYMKDGDVCEVEISSLGVLRNGIRDEN
jgi:acylpyruvate hydrolase